MQNEYIIGYTAVGSIVGLAVTCLFYMLGGRSGKWRRRYVASFIQAINSNVCSLIMGVWNPFLLLIYPLMVGCFSLGYGGDNFGTKVIRRSIFASAQICVGLVFCFTLGGKAWLVLVPHLGVAIWSIWLGIKNPLYAAAEEVFICAANNLFLCAYPFTAM